MPSVSRNRSIRMQISAKLYFLHIKKCQQDVCNTGSRPHWALQEFCKQTKKTKSWQLKISPIWQDNVALEESKPLLNGP